MTVGVGGNSNRRIFLKKVGLLTLGAFIGCKPNEYNLEDIYNRYTEFRFQVVERFSQIYEVITPGTIYVDWIPETDFIRMHIHANYPIKRDGFYTVFGVDPNGAFNVLFKDVPSISGDTLKTWYELRYGTDEDFKEKLNLRRYLVGGPDREKTYEVIHCNTSANQKNLLSV